MRVLLLHNPGAGREDHPREELTRLLEAEGHEVIYRHIKKDEIDPAEAEAAELVVIAGGDGTVGKAVQALAEVDRPFLILPLGTANNIARCMGLPKRPADSLRGIAAARERLLDFGHIRGPWGERVFIEGVGLGAVAEMILAGTQVDGDSEKKRRFGEEAPQRFVRQAEPGEWRVRADGLEVPGGMLFAEVLNMPMVGPSLPLGPGDCAADGLLSLTVLRPDGREAFARWLEGPRERPVAGIETMQVERVEFLWQGAALRIDDHFPETPAEPAAVEMATARRKLRILVPRKEGDKP